MLPLALTNCAKLTVPRGFAHRSACRHVFPFIALRAIANLRLNPAHSPDHANPWDKSTGRTLLVSL